MFVLFLLLSIPVALLVFGAGYAAAIMWHAEPLTHGRAFTETREEELSGRGWTATDSLIMAGLRLNR